MLTVALRPGEDRRLQAGHLWVFSNELQQHPRGAQPGDLIAVRRAGGAVFGIGFYHPRSLISVRILDKLDRLPEDEEAWFEKLLRARLAAAATVRSRAPAAAGVRMVYGESDRLPGLVVDRYGRVLVLQMLSAGMDRRREMIVRVLMELWSPEAIYERDDAALRRLEDLPERTGLLAGTLPDGAATAGVPFEENGLRLMADVVRGQKTGWYLDQRANRQRVASRCPGETVLDLFCHTGGFAVAAARAGAARVMGVDGSAEALAMARAHAEMNGVADRCEFLPADAFQYLESAAKEGQTFGVVIVDPPSFARSRAVLPTALKGYRRLNRLALSVVKPGGILATASCSGHVTREMFLSELSVAADRAGRFLRILELAGQADDHPVHPAMPETEYLKFVVCHVE